jgi:hypothetical protein
MFPFDFVEESKLKGWKVLETPPPENYQYHNDHHTETPNDAASDGSGH